MDVKAIWDDLTRFYSPDPVWAATPDAVANPPQAKAPEFAAASSVVLTTFSVIIGIAIQDFLDPKVAAQFKAIYWFAFAMMMTAVLRYLIGSAVHFTYTYGSRTPGPRCGSPYLFFKDIAFLVLFGALAVSVTQALEFGHFVRRLMWFLALGACGRCSTPSCEGSATFRPSPHTGSSSFGSFGWSSTLHSC
jgi:hypothetical protein